MENKILQLSDQYNLYKADVKEKKYFLFNLHDGSIFRLNEVSFTMLSLFDGKKTVGAVENMLKDMYNTDIEKLKKDFSEMVSHWVQKEILIVGGKNEE